jgi:hypothetical protein
MWPRWLPLFLRHSAKNKLTLKTRRPERERIV